MSKPVQAQMFAERQYICAECGKWFVPFHHGIFRYVSTSRLSEDCHAQFYGFCSRHCRRAWTEYHEYLEHSDDSGEME